MLIEFDRESVCMGDDCDSHVVTKQIDDSLLISELLEELVRYVPSMTNAVWAVYSVGSCFDGVTGYITSAGQKTGIRLNVEDRPIKDLFGGKEAHIFCRYYYEGRFAWKNEYPKGMSLLEKVMKDCCERLVNSQVKETRLKNVSGC